MLEEARGLQAGLEGAEQNVTGVKKFFNAVGLGLKSASKALRGYCEAIDALDNRTSTKIKRSQRLKKVHHILRKMEKCFVSLSIVLLVASFIPGVIVLSIPALALLKVSLLLTVFTRLILLEVPRLTIHYTLLLCSLTLKLFAKAANGCSKIAREAIRTKESLACVQGLVERLADYEENLPTIRLQLGSAAAPELTGVRERSLVALRTGTTIAATLPDPVAQENEAHAAQLFSDDGSGDGEMFFTASETYSSDGDGFIVRTGTARQYDREAVLA